MIRTIQVEYCKRMFSGEKEVSSIKEFIERRGWTLRELEDCIMINIRSDVFYISYELIVENGHDKIIQYCKDRSFMYERLAL